jgi:rhomboid protease GluP
MDASRPQAYFRQDFGNRPEPEILPPLENPRLHDTPPTRPRSRPSWSYAPATYLLVAINCAVYLVMTLSGISVFGIPTSEQLLHWGASAGVFVLLNGEWWRLLSAAFVHIGFLHLATNMWCLWNLGLLGEPLLGPAGMMGVYLLSGIAGNLLSTAMNPRILGAGASGAVFGLAGVLILLLRSPLLPVPQAEIKRLRNSVIFFAILNFAIGAGSSLSNFSLKIDNFAHMGGFLCGILMGFILVPRIGAPRQQFLARQRVAISSTAVLLLLMAYGIYSFWYPVLAAQFQHGGE